MAATHELKCWPQYFARLLDGSKTFEFRREDRGYQKGDFLVLHEYDPTGTHDGPCDDDPTCHTACYSGRVLRFQIGYVLHTQVGAACIEHAILSLLPVQEESVDAVFNYAEGVTGTLAQFGNITGGVTIR